jgi:hypothetical protein
MLSPTVGAPGAAGAAANDNTGRVRTSQQK